MLNLFFAGPRSFNVVVLTAVFVYCYLYYVAVFCVCIPWLSYSVPGILNLFILTLTTGLSFYCYLFCVLSCPGRCAIRCNGRFAWVSYLASVLCKLVRAGCQRVGSLTVSPSALCKRLRGRWATKPGGYPWFAFIPAPMPPLRMECKGFVRNARLSSLPGRTIVEFARGAS
jgi:hypothetical protein